DQPAKEPPPKEDQPAKEPSPKEDQPPKEPPPKEDQPLKEPPPEEDQPKEPPPKEDQPKEPPPNEDQPKEPPPNEDQPKEPPPKEEPPKDPESNPPTNTPKANNPKDNNANPKQDEAVVINSSNLIKTPDISPPQNPKELSLTPPTFNSLPDELSSQSKPDKNAINKNDNSNIDKSISDSDQATSTAYNPTKVNDPLSNPSSTTQSILPPTTLGVPISPFDPRSPYRIPAIIGLVIAILLALFSLAFLLRKTVFSKKYSTPYQRTYSVDGSIHNKLIQRQYSMTDHGLPPWSPTSFDNDAEEIRLPSPTVIRKSCSPPDSHLVDINLNENMSSTAYKNIESSSSTNAKRSSFYKDLARKSSLLRYVKDFDDDIIEEESNMSSNYDYPNLPDQAVTWEECMK
ncbi:18484_t:CDS:1, partial [Funneliformis geosporum]